MLEITVAQFEAIPREWRTTRCKSPIPGVGGWVSVRITDDVDGLPFSAVSKKAVGLYIHNPQEITIAVWADGAHAPVIGTPEEHLAKLVDECHGNPAVTPVKYFRWNLEGSTWCCYGVRRVEMRPVVLP